MDAKTDKFKIPSSFEEYERTQGPFGMLLFFRPMPNSQDPKETQPCSGLLPLTALDIPKPTNPAWQPLKIAIRLGVHFVYVTPKECSAISTQGKSGYDNEIFEVMTTDCDPTSPGFGKGLSIKEPVVIKFSNPTTMLITNAPVESMYLFVRESLPRIKHALATRGLEAAKAEYAKMNPTVFKVYFKHYRLQDSIENPKARWRWEQPRPVVIDHAACESCGKDTAAAAAAQDSSVSGSPFLKCARCKKVSYCNRKCQKVDWKFHKPYCVAEK